jgi:hypothetical protein
MQSDSIKKLFINKYYTVGEEKFYKFLITYALNRVVEPANNKIVYNPAIELMDYYDMFLKLYRKEGEKIYLDLAKQFRRAGHRIYRIGLKKGLMEKNNKFLNVA